jgi:hypothetical protein
MIVFLLYTPSIIALSIPIRKCEIQHDIMMLSVTMKTITMSGIILSVYKTNVLAPL